MLQALQNALNRTVHALLKCTAVKLSFLFHYENAISASILNKIAELILLDFFVQIFIF